MNRIARISLVLLSIASVTFVGCNTTDSGVGQKLDASSQEVHVEKGMSVEELISSLGEPRERRPTEPVREGFEVWVYEKKYTVVEMKVTGNKETPHFDPITGVSTPIIDPVYGQESTRVKQTTQFLIAEGRVVSWKVERDQDRDYN